MKHKINTNDYDSIWETSRYFLANNGCEYFIETIPSIYDHVDSRYYKVIKCTDSNGEPMIACEFEFLTAEELYDFGKKFNI